MPELSTLLLFSVAAFALTATPGPDMLLIASRSAAQGRAAGLATYCGIATGAYCHVLAAALGLSQLFIAVPATYDIVRYAGAAYLLYLAITVLRSKKGSDAALPPEQASHWRVYRQGLLTNLLNPKVALFVLALFPQFVDPQRGSVVVQMLVLGTVLNGIGLITNGVVILAASRIRSAVSRSAKIQHLSNYLLATVFGALAARLVFEPNK